MKSIKMISVLIIVIAIGAYIIVKSTLTHIPVGIVGVRTQEYAIIGKKGVVQEDFAPGWRSIFTSPPTAMQITATLKLAKMDKVRATAIGICKP